MRIVSWNILAGGGKRAAAIAEQLERWRPSQVVLCEYRGTPPSQNLAARLSSFKFEVHHSLDSMEAFLGCSVAQPFSGPGVQFLGYRVTVLLRDEGLAGRVPRALRRARIRAPKIRAVCSSSAGNSPRRLMYNRNLAQATGRCGRAQPWFRDLVGSASCRLASSKSYGVIR
jgi:hypothetical protein